MRHCCFGFCAVFASILFLSSCMTLSTFNKLVDAKITKDDIKPVQVPFENIVVRSASPLYTESAFVSKKNASYFLPLFFYWQKVDKIECRVNSKYFENLLLVALKEVDDEFDLGQYMKDRYLEVMINTVPDKFVYDDRYYGRTTAVCYSLYYKKVKPVNKKLKITFNVLENYRLLKTVEYDQEIVADMVYQNYDTDEPGKYMITDYLGVLRANYISHCQKAILKLIDELS